jgi:hypothetical protein
MLAPTIGAFCAAARVCCSQQGVSAMLDDCESAFPMKHESIALLTSGVLTLNATVLAACLAAFRQAAVACDQNPVLSACDDLLVGTRPEDAACNSGWECAPAPVPTICLAAATTDTVGVCKNFRRAKAGEECHFSCQAGEHCPSFGSGFPETDLDVCLGQDGLYCGAGGRCEVLLALGAPCRTDEQCGSANFCQGTCMKRGELGDVCAACLPSLTCTNNHCATSPFASDSTCTGHSPVLF